MKRHLLIIALIIFGALSLSGCTRVTLSPDQLLVNGLAELIEAETLTTTIDATLDQVPVKSAVFSRTFEAVTGHATIEFDRTANDGPATATKLEFKDKNGDALRADLRVIGQTAFLNIEALPKTDELDLSAFINEPFYVPFTDIAALTPGLGSLSTLERSALAEVVRHTPDLFIGIEELPDEQIDGQETKHMRARLNPDAINRLLSQLAALQGVPARQFAFADIDAAPLELWVSTKTGALTKVTSDFTDVQGHTGTFSATISDLDERLSIEGFANATALTFDELTKRLQQSNSDQPQDAGDSADTVEPEDSTESQSSDDNTEETATNESDDTPNVDSGDTTTPYAPDVPFPIQ